MITKYRAQDFKWNSAKIVEIQVERETESSVFIGGRRHGKHSEYAHYYDTWDEAHAFLTEIAKGKVMDARRRLENANGFAGNVKGMKKPMEAA